MPRKYICPGCKAKEGVNIEYGMPSYEAFEASQRGEIALGGCVIGENDPERRCLKCGHEWHIKRRLSLASDNLLDAPPPPQGWMMCVYASEENQAAADKSRRKHNLKVLRQRKAYRDYFGKALQELEKVKEHAESLVHRAEAQGN